MRILVTNDDGWDAPGLARLLALARQFGDAVAVAPRERRSGCGHQLTFHRDLAVESCDGGIWRVDGMPGDCVRIALSRFGPFDWVLSGINDGANLGVDIHLSGTVAAAREAMILGVRAMAISQYRASLHAPPDWERSGALASRAIRELLRAELPAGRFWNVNLPDCGAAARGEETACESSAQPVTAGETAGAGVPLLVHCPVDPSPLPMDYDHGPDFSRWKGRYSARSRLPDHDIDVCFGGQVAVSLI